MLFITATAKQNTLDNKMNDKNYSPEFERLLKVEELSIASHKFYLKYLKKEALSDKECIKIKNKLDEIFPDNAGCGAPLFHSDFGPVVAILPQTKDFEVNQIFGYAGIDNFNRVVLIPEYGCEFIFKSTHNQDKYDSLMDSIHPLERKRKEDFYHETVASYLNNYLKFSHASDLDMNFTVDYPTPIIRGQYNVTAFMIDTRMVDWEITIENYG